MKYLFVCKLLYHMGRKRDLKRDMKLAQTKLNTQIWTLLYVMWFTMGSRNMTSDPWRFEVWTLTQFLEYLLVAHLLLACFVGGGWRGVGVGVGGAGCGGGGGGCRGGTAVISRVSDGRCSGVFGGERRRKRVNNGARVDLWGGDTCYISSGWNINIFTCVYIY